jgi:drug/metabolite transporter (DMT)-like permease
MLSVLLAFSGSLIYGASDFLGGIAARGMSAIRVTFLNALVGVTVLLLGSLLVPARWSSGAILWGGLSGVAGSAALILLYACLAIGPMSILAPIMGLVSAALPVGIGFARGERLDLAGIFGIVLGLVAVVLVCLVPDRRAARASGRGILLAVGAGMAVGAYLVFIDLSPPASGPAPLTASFVVSGMVSGIILIGQRLIRRGPRVTSVGSQNGDRSRSSTLIAAIAAGLTDAAAAILFLIALRLGDLSVVSVLSALSPAGTVLLAAIVLHERIARVQWVGLASALIAAALLSLA